MVMVWRANLMGSGIEPTPYPISSKESKPYRSSRFDFHFTMLLYIHVYFALTCHLMNFFTILLFYYFIILLFYYFIILLLFYFISFHFILFLSLAHPKFYSLQLILLCFFNTPSKLTVDLTTIIYHFTSLSYRIRLICLNAIQYNVIQFN